jgi:palmitoyltransferase ZDHHC2/15/20
MGELDRSFSSNSIGKACANIEADLSNHLPPWSEATSTQRMHILSLYLLIGLPVLVLLGVVFTGYIFYVVFFVSELLSDSGDTPELWYWHSDHERHQAKARGIVFLSVETVALCMLLLSHFKAMLTDPGRIPDSENWAVPSDDSSSQNSDNQRLAEKSKRGNTRSCSHCKRKKPDRAHHCRQCNRCNLKMDHHCNWIANCVGYANYKFFFLMVFYGSIALGLFTATFWECVAVTLNDSESSTEKCLMVVLVYSLISMLSIAVIGFCFFHLWLISRNFTTIEYCEKARKDVPGYNHSPFSGGSVYQNFKDALGDNPLLWLVPTDYREPDTGLYFR